MHRILHGHVPGGARGLPGLWDRLYRGFRERLGAVGTPLILTYRKFGMPELIRIGGRVVEDRGVVSAAHTASTAENLWLTLKRYAAYEVPGAKIRIHFGAETHIVVTDAKGFFEVEIGLSEPVRLPAAESWLPVKVGLVDAPG